MTVVTWNGSNYSVPATGEEDWGGSSKVDGLLIALATHGFQKAGGTFTLLADADFGATAGLKALYYKSRAATVASAGVVRLSKSETMGWRNNADGGDLLFSVNASDQLLFNGSTVIGLSPSLTISRAVVSDGTGALVSATTTAIEIGYVNGVSSAIQTQLNTGATNLTTHAALTIAHGATGAVVGTTNTQVLTGKTLTASDNTLTGLDGPRTIRNLAISTSNNGTALTIALKTNAAADASATDKIFIAFRSSTLTTGTYVLRTVTAALSTVISSGSTGGFTSATSNFLYVYAIDNAGTVELAWSASRLFDENTVYTTTAEGGAGAADDRFTLYSTTARTGVAVRLIGQILFTLTTAGTWNESGDEISTVFNGEFVDRSEIVLTTANGHGSTNTTIRKWTTIEKNVGTALSVTQSATNGDLITILKDGVYASVNTDYDTAGSVSVGCSLNSSQLTTAIAAITAADRLSLGTTSGANIIATVTAVRRLKVGDILRQHTSGGLNGTTISKWSVTRLGN